MGLNVCEISTKQCLGTLNRQDFRLINVLLTADDDELTPTMKLKRSFVETKHGELISQMY